SAVASSNPRALAGVARGWVAECVALRRGLPVDPAAGIDGHRAARGERELREPLARAVALAEPAQREGRWAEAGRPAAVGPVRAARTRRVANRAAGSLQAGGLPGATAPLAHGSRGERFPALDGPPVRRHLWTHVARLPLSPDRGPKRLDRAARANA